VKSVPHAECVRRKNPVRKLIFAAVILIAAIGPLAARAGERPILVQTAMPAVSDTFDRNQAFAIGAGIVLGATAGSVLSVRGAILVGAVAGGLIGAWWYSDHSEFATLEPRIK
jgi:hypothetical protein